MKNFEGSKTQDKEMLRQIKELQEKEAFVNEQLSRFKGMDASMKMTSQSMPERPQAVPKQPKPQPQKPTTGMSEKDMLKMLQQKYGISE
jgi:hypothetical protein